MRRLTTTTIACYSLLTLAGAAPLDMSGLMGQDSAPKASAAAIAGAEVPRIAQPAPVQHSHHTEAAIRIADRQR